MPTRCDMRYAHISWDRQLPCLVCYALAQKTHGVMFLFVASVGLIYLEHHKPLLWWQAPLRRRQVGVQHLSTALSFLFPQLPAGCPLTQGPHTRNWRGIEADLLPRGIHAAFYMSDVVETRRCLPSNTCANSSAA